MNLYKHDIKAIGHTAYEVEGCLAIIASPDNAGIERILLREILALSGDEIVAADDFEWTVEGSENAGTDIRWLTSMPWDEYRSQFPETKKGDHANT